MSFNNSQSFNQNSNNINYQWFFSNNNDNGIMFGDLSFSPLTELSNNAMRTTNNHHHHHDYQDMMVIHTNDDRHALPSSSSSSILKPKEKKKPKMACIFCNRQHKKCDGEPPNTCSRCAKKSIPCVYLPPQKRGPKSKKRKADEDDCYSVTDGDQQSYSSSVINQQIIQQQFNASVNSFTSQSDQQQQTTSNNSQRMVSSVDLDTYISEALFTPSNKGGTTTNPTIYQSSPLSGLQFVANVHTRTLVDQFLDSVTCHSLVERNMLDNALNKTLTYSSEPTGYKLLTNIVCALGAQRLEDRKNCIEFFNRARNQASYLFDIPSKETSCALSLMGIYACSEGERIKCFMYNRIALAMSTNMCEYQVENDKYFQSMSALSLATTFSKWLFELNMLRVEENSIDILLKHGNNPNHPQVPSICEVVKSVKAFINSYHCTHKMTELETRISEMNLVKGSEEIAFTATLLYYLLISRLASLNNNNQVEYIKFLRKLETMEKYIESDKFNKDDLQKNVHRFCLYSLRADILVKCGLEKMGLHCATKATGLAAKSTFWKSAPAIILFFPVLINVNLNVNDSSMSIENYKSLKIISSKFAVLKYTLSDMIATMNKRPEFSDLLVTEKQPIPQAISNTSGNCSNDLVPLCESCPIGQDGWDTNLFDDVVNTNESCIQTSDISEMLQQLGTAHDQESYQNKLESIWQSITQ